TSISSIGNCPDKLIYSHAQVLNQRFRIVHVMEVSTARKYSPSSHFVRLNCIGSKCYDISTHRLVGASKRFRNNNIMYVNNILGSWTSTVVISNCPYVLVQSSSQSAHLSSRVGVVGKIARAAQHSPLPAFTSSHSISC